jgi:ketosteroid isomerase-like protein
MRFWQMAVSVAALSVSTALHAAPVDDAVAMVTSTLDKFNGGDVDAFVAAHRDGAIILDEFAPYAWGGSGSVKTWLDGYAADATTRHITDGRVDYEQPIQANSDGTSAYIVLPTVYSFKQDGKAMAGKGSMTFVMVKSGKDWKISAWSYNGETPKPR